jgi:hypothetical protein
VLLVVAIVGLITWELISHLRAQQDEKERTEKAELQRQDTIINGLANRYHAVIDWRPPFNDDRYLSTIYSAELTPLLIRSDNRPILAIGSVRDVASEAGAYSIQLFVSVNLSTKVIFSLQAERRQAEQIMDNSDQRALNSLMKWAVVAQISSVKSPGLGEGRDGNEVDETPPQSIAYGRCLDLAYLGLYFDDLLPEQNPNHGPSPQAFPKPQN